MKPIVLKINRKFYEETARNRILKILFLYPEESFSLSELAKEAGVSKANIGEILKDLYRIEMIKIEKLSKIWRIKANQTSWVYIRNKIIFNLSLVYEIGIIKYLIDHYKNPKAIILFGGFRKGEDLSTSDIDIAIESDDVNDYKIIELNEKIIDRKIQLHLFNRKNINIETFNNIANGIVLWGFLEVKK